MLRLIRGHDRATAAIVAANRWLAEFDRDISDLAAASHPTIPDAMTKAARRETEKRLAAGIGAWNGWSLDMLAMRDAKSQAARLLWRLCADTDLTRSADPVSRDLCGYILPGAFDARGCRIERLWTSGTQFCGDVLFGGASFECSVDFQNSIVRGALDLRAATFAERAEFRGLRAQGPVMLDGACFETDVWFAGAVFGGPVRARAARFDSDAGFAAARFSGATDFSGARFMDNAGFEGAIFDGAVDFSDAVFARNTWFRNAAFNGPVKFDRTRFSGSASFEGIAVPHNQSPARAAIASIEGVFASA